MYRPALFVPGFLFSLLVLLLGGCVMASHPDKPVTRIVFAYKDAAVPPQYHRSYTITVTREQVHLIVDSYGDVLADVTTDMPEKGMENLLKDIDIQQICQSNRDSAQHMGTGGASASLIFYSGSNILLNGEIQQCAGRFEGNLAGEAALFLGRVEALIPNFEQLVKSH